MHVAQQLAVDSFEIFASDGTPIGTQQVFPNWNEHDRVGVIVSEPLGLLNASLLYQLAIALFYDVKPSRRDTTPTYPEFYVFHLGDSKGDFSYFDVWPSYKERFLKVRKPTELLAELNTCGVTRLFLPEGYKADAAILRSGLSTWADTGSFLERVQSCFVYRAGGSLDTPNLRIDSRDPRVFENIDGTIDPRPTINELRSNPTSPETEDPLLSHEGNLRWCDRVETRLKEISQEVRDHFSEQRTMSPAFRSEEYRMISAKTALLMIAGM